MYVWSCSFADGYLQQAITRSDEDYVLRDILLSLLYLVKIICVL